jgi:CBS domain containing-hemolysin-like protein
LIDPSQLVALIILIGLSAFFGGIEVALVAVSDVKVEELFQRGVKGAAALRRLKQNPTRMITTIMIGNNLVNVAAAAIATEIAISLFGSLGVGIATGVMTFIILVFGEITPKAYCNAHAEELSLRFARLIELLTYAFYPGVLLFEWIAKGVLKLTGTTRAKPTITHEELEALVEVGAREGAIDREERAMIRGVLEFGDTTVRAVMTPRTRMFTLDADLTVGEALPLINRSGYSRIPLTEGGSKDRVVGILHVRDVLKALQRPEGQRLRLRDLARKPFFVSQETIVSDLFKEFQRRRVHMAIVIDEYGGVEGLVTLEDLIEEIVGEVMDEKDVSPELIVRVDKDTIVVHGDTDIDQVNDYFNITLPKEADYSTISGLLHHLLKDLPEPGDRVDVNGLSLIVEETVENRPTRVRIIKQAKEAEAAQQAQK